MEYVGNKLDLRAGERSDPEHITQGYDDTREGLRGLAIDIMGKRCILGTDENAFKLEKTLDILDQFNIYHDEDDAKKWYPIHDRYLRQKISITKTEINSITIRLKNTTHLDIPVTFSIKNMVGDEIGTNQYSIPKGTEIVTYEIPFNIKYAPQGDYYFIIHPVNINTSDLSISGDEDLNMIDWSINPVAIMYDFEGNYNKSLQSSDNGEFYEQLNIHDDKNNTEYFPEADLWFEEKFTKNNTYYVKPGVAQILGEYVVALDSHISIHGPSEYGNRTDLIGLGADGHFRVIDGEIWTDKEVIPEIPNEDLLEIAYITTWKDLNKFPTVYQDDTTVEGKKTTRVRDLVERVRRLEKQNRFNNDNNLPARIKYDRDGNSLKDITEGDGTKISTHMNNLGQTVWSIDINNKITSKYWSFKNFNTDNNPIPAMHSNTDGISELVNIDYSDNENGIIQLAKEEDIDTQFSTYLNESDMYPQFRNKQRNRRVFTIYKNTDEWISNYPAFGFNISKNTLIKNIELDIREFRNMENIQVSIFKKNDNWITRNGEEHIFTSKVKTLTNAKTTNNNLQVLEVRPVFEVGVKLTEGKYVIIIHGTPIGNNGKIYVNTFNGPEKEGFLVRYQGTFPPNRFLQQNVYNETFGIRSNQDIVRFKKEGSLLSESIQASAGSKIAGASFKGTIKVPNGCSYLIEGSVDGGKTWLPFRNNKITFSNTGKQFRWKITLYGNSDKSPKIYYDKDNEYALVFNISEINETENINIINTISDSSYVFNSMTFDAKEILKSQLIDTYYSQIDTTFNIFEYARLWGNDNDGKMVVDIESSGSKIGNQRFWSTILTDLTLDDFKQESVDYSNYTNDVDYDEHNYKFDYMSDFYSSGNNQLITTGISGWGDINKNGINGVEYDYNTLDPLFGDRTSIVKFVEDYSDRNKIFIGKRFKDGIDLSKFQQIMVSITPKLDNNKIGFKKTDLIPYHAIKFVISLGESGETGNYSEGKEYWFYNDLVRGEPNNILIDISQDLHGFTNVKSIGFKLNSDENYIYTFQAGDSLQVNYISGESQNKAQLVPDGGRWTSLKTGCSITTSNNMNVFTLNGEMGANKLAKIAVSRPLDIWNLAHFRISVNQPIQKGKFYFDFCSDIDGDHVIMSVPIPTIKGISANSANYVNIIKKIKNNQSTIKSVILRSNTESISNLIINLQNLWTYTNDNIPLFNDALRMKVYTIIDNNLLMPSEIRKMGVIFRV